MIILTINTIVMPWKKGKTKSKFKSKAKAKTDYVPKSKNKVIAKTIDTNDIVRFRPIKGQYFPNEMITSFKSSYSFYGITGDNFFKFDVKLNSLYLPWDVLAGGTIQLGSVASGTTLSAKQTSQPVTSYLPPGVPPLVGSNGQVGIYKNFIVYGSKITVNVATGGISNNPTIVIVPYNVANIGFVGTSELSQARNMPNAVVRQITGGSVNKPIINSITVPRMVGCTPAEFQAAAMAYSINTQALSPYAGSIVPASDPTVGYMWRVLAYEPDGVNWTSSPECTVEVEHYCRLINLNQLPGFSN